MIKNLFNGIFLLIITMSIAIIANAQAQNKKSISAESFGRLPTFQEINLSPDGTKVASIRNIKGNMSIVTQSLEPGHEKEVYLLTYEDGKISYLKWLSNTRILIALKFQRKRKNDTYYRHRYVAIDWNKTNPINLVKGKYQIDPDSVSIVSHLDNDSDHVLIRMKQKPINGTSKFTYDIFKVNIHNAYRERIMTGPVRMIGGLSGTTAADANGVIRMKYGHRNSKFFYSYRKSEKDNFQKIYEFKSSKQNKEDRKSHKNEIFEHVGFTKDPNYIYVLSNHENGLTALYEFNVNDRSMRPTEIRNEKSGIDFVLIDPHTDEIMGYSYVNEKPVFIYLNKDLAQIRKELSSFFPGEYIRFETYTTDKMKLIFSVTSPTRPREYFLQDRKLMRITKFAANYPLVDISVLSKMIITSYKNRDDDDIPAYLSLPKGKEKTKNMPTIILPHGGPNSRDVWGFDSWVQFLTSRGYAVLQMNFRGSTGYGAKYLFKGDYEYGRGMLDDINDGAKWMIDQGYADPDNICIMGASYGGYAALQASIREKSLYKCIISMAPVTDLTRLKRNEWFLYDFDLFTDDTMSLKDISPYYQVDRLNVPILLFHGRKDNVVPYVHSELLAEKLKDKKKNIRFITFDNGDHHLSHQENRIKFLKEAGIFLKQQLK